MSRELGAEVPGGLLELLGPVEEARWVLGEETHQAAGALAAVAVPWQGVAALPVEEPVGRIAVEESWPRSAPLGIIIIIT